jgi:hypothetical protein
MNSARLFQSLLVIYVLLSVLNSFLPIESWYSGSGLHKLMEFDGYGAVLSPGSVIPPFVSAVPMWGLVFACIGMFFFQNWARYLYLTLWMYFWCLTLIFGVRIVLPIQSFISMAIGTLDGAILALAFLSSLRAAFTSSEHIGTSAQHEPE